MQIRAVCIYRFGRSGSGYRAVRHRSFAEGRVDAPIYYRARLGTGDRIHGPAIIAATLRPKRRSPPIRQPRRARPILLDCFNARSTYKNWLDHASLRRKLLMPASYSFPV